ncbi:MAG: wax ester/triacylglycerol synthase domain-containing protein [Candidatus Dormibacteria bacterium]
MASTQLDRLAREDERILELEHGSVVGHTCKVLIVDGVLTADEVRAAVAPRLDAAPRLRQRLQPLPRGLGTPVWVPASDFDLKWHVADAAAVPDESALRESVAALMADRLDRTRPLWRIDVVQLGDDRTALVWRVHHCMADGVTALRLGGDVLWEEEGVAARPTATERPQQAGHLEPGSLVTLAARERVDAALARARAAITEVRAAARLRDALPDVRAVASSVRRELTPTTLSSPFDAPLGRRRSIAWTSLSLARLHDAAKRIDASVTLNDAVIALVATGIRDWLTSRQRSVPALRVRIPVSLHGSDATGDQANRDSFIDIDVPLGAESIFDRVKAVNAQTLERKREHDAEHVDWLLREMSRVPLGGHALALTDGSHEFALCVSNVPGPRGGIAVAGRGVQQLHSVVEVAPHHDLRASVVSSAGRLSFAMCADADRLDPNQVVGGIEMAAAQLQ